MAEHHAITGPARGEPRSARHVGACVRLPLDAAPTPRWSQALSAHLHTGLLGHPAVGHLGLDRVVQGTDIVLDGVEVAEAALLGPVLRGAIDAANRACAGSDGDGEGARNMDRAQAEAVARAVRLSAEA
jgi:hypothetical protein